MDERFKKLEDEYFLLRGLREIGRLTREEFESRLKEMMIQDAQGRWWILGVNDAKWYVNDGTSWVEATPPPTTAVA